MVNESIKYNNSLYSNKIGGCDFDEADPSKFIIKLFNSEERTLELRFIKIDNNECTCNLLIVNLKDMQLNSKMISLITSLNGYLVLIDRIVLDNRIMFINENKVLIQTEVLDSIKFAVSVPGTNDVIISTWHKVYFLLFNENNNDLEVKAILEYQCSIHDIRIQNDHLIIEESLGLIYIYKLDDIKQNNTTNQVVINKKLKEYCISSCKKYFIFTTDGQELFVYKLDDEIKQIACLKLNEEMISLVSNEKYISMVDESNKNILTFEIIDETI